MVQPYLLEVLACILLINRYGKTCPQEKSTRIWKDRPKRYDHESCSRASTRSAEQHRRRLRQDEPGPLRTGPSQAAVKATGSDKQAARTTCGDIKYIRYD